MSDRVILAVTEKEYRKAEGVFAAAKNADFVSLHLPLVEATAGFIGARRLRVLQRHTWLINIARGGLLDEEALFRSLDANLRSLPNVIMTPHVGSSTAEACRRMAQRALRNALFGEQRRWGEMDLLNPEVVQS